MKYLVEEIEDIQIGNKRDRLYHILPIELDTLIIIEPPKKIVATREQLYNLIQNGQVINAITFKQNGRLGIRVTGPVKRMKR